MNLDHTEYTPLLQFRSQISANGRLNIPSGLRKAAKLKDGDELILTLKDDVIQIQLLDQVITQVQDLVAHYFASDDLMEDLKEIRSKDAKLEIEQFDQQG
jgi:AbrB family looped-hinge helix DNA binding protein